jgi:beta-phosphoglucomutase-like phosphatase (HAD superfamily)
VLDHRQTELFARRGLPFGDEQKAMLIGRTIPAACTDLADLFGEPGGGPALESELLTLVSEVVEASAKPMPGAHDIVEAVASRVPVAVASNSPRSLLDAALTRGRLNGRFPVSLSANDLEHAKPAPDMYLAAATPVGRRAEYVRGLQGLPHRRAFRTRGRSSLRRGAEPARG